MKDRNVLLAGAFAKCKGNCEPSLQKNSGRACKPDCPASPLFSVSCAESTNMVCQRSQFWQGKQVLWHSYGTVACLLWITLHSSADSVNTRNNQLHQDLPAFPRTPFLDHGVADVWEERRHRAEGNSEVMLERITIRISVSAV